MLKTIFSCEHGGNQIPEKYKPLFENQQHLLTTFKSYDIGAMNLYKDLLEEMGDHGNHFQYCRMLVDVDKDINSHDLFSQTISKLTTREQNKILKDYYFPWREELEKQIAALAKSNHVLHCSIHTFSPLVNDEKRDVDVAVLFEPERKLEALFAEKFISFLQEENPKLRIKANYPIPGGNEGFVHHLKQQKFSKKYIGIQLEVSQAFPLGKSDKWIALKQQILKSFKISLKELKTNLLK
jgi:predicted N-formylglutamate amidohydrolase